MQLNYKSKSLFSFIIFLFATNIWCAKDIKSEASFALENIEFEFAINVIDSISANNIQNISKLNKINFNNDIEKILTARTIQEITNSHIKLWFSNWERETLTNFFNSNAGVRLRKNNNQVSYFATIMKETSDDKQKTLVKKNPKGSKNTRKVLLDKIIEIQKKEKEFRKIYLTCINAVLNAISSSLPKQLKLHVERGMRKALQKKRQLLSAADLATFRSIFENKFYRFTTEELVEYINFIESNIGKKYNLMMANIRIVLIKKAYYLATKRFVGYLFNQPLYQVLKVNYLYIKKLIEKNSSLKMKVKKKSTTKDL